MGTNLRNASEFKEREKFIFELVAMNRHKLGAEMVRYSGHRETEGNPCSMISIRDVVPRKTREIVHVSFQFVNETFSNIRFEFDTNLERKSVVDF